VLRGVFFGGRSAAATKATGAGLSAAPDAQQRDRKLCLMDQVSIEDLPNDDVEALKAEMRAQA
jgi:hypothetical protein